MSRARFRVNSHWIPDCQGIPYSKQIPDSTTKLGYVVKIRSMHVKLWNSELQYITWRLYIYIDISSRNVCNIFIHLMIINIRETWSCELYSFYLFLSYSWINIALFNHWAPLIYDILLTDMYIYIWSDLCVISLIANTCSVIDLLLRYAACDIGIAVFNLKLLLFDIKNANIFGIKELFVKDLMLVLSVFLPFVVLLKLRAWFHLDVSSVLLHISAIFSYTTSGECFISSKVIWSIPGI